jgi:hypothetical protein
MIAKGTTHNNGAKLASYMTTGKDGERAELWQLRGFASNDIKDAFRSVHVMAEATKCEQPFFHVQVRNREGEKLTRQQWETSADRIERINGLTGQPRAIAFHIDERTGEEHMHVTWSLIDEDTMKAKPLRFFKYRLKTISRELEKEFGLQPVKNERESPIKYAPTRAQDEQARRLGIDIHKVRDTIRHCWDRSDNGRSFQAALEHEGLILAAGDQRGLVVIDHAGGIHALGKRILDVTPGQMKARMSDLARDELPSVAEVRAFVAEVTHTRQPQANVMDRLKQELAEVDRLLYGPPIADLRREAAMIDQLLANSAMRQRQPEKAGPVWDREQATVRDEIQWQEALEKAAIAKEEKERQFVERDRTAPAGPAPGLREEKHWPINPPQHQSWPSFGKAATEATRDERTQDLRGPAAQVWAAWCEIDKDAALTPAQEEEARRLGVTIHEARERVIAAKLAGKTVSFSVPPKEVFAASLDDRGISFAAVTKEEAERSHREAEFAKAVGNYAPRFKQGEIVIITEQRPEYRRDDQAILPARVHKLDQSLAEKFTKHLGIRSQLQGIDATLKLSDERMQQRRADRETTRLERATNTKPPIRVPIRAAAANVKHGIHKTAAVIGKAATLAAPIGKALDLVGGMVEVFAAPKLTPQQIHDGEKAKDRREAEADFSIDFSRATAEAAQQRQQQENEREAARQRPRDEGRERDR